MGVWWSVWLLAGTPALACAQRTAPPSAGPAQPAPSAAPADSAPQVTHLEEARSHFRLGMQLFDARSYREALREFELVDRLAPSAELWFNIGRAHEELGEYEAAARALERYLRDRVDASDAAEVRAKIQTLETLAARQRERGQSATDSGSLRIHVHAASAPPKGTAPVMEGALVLLDGRRVATDTLDEPLLLPSGRHQLDVIAPDRIPMHAQVSIEPGLLTAAYLDLAPRTHARTRPSSHAFTWGALGLAGAGAITSGVFAGLALSEQSSGDVRRAEVWALRTDVALAGTAVCVFAAALLYYIEGRSARTEFTRTPARRYPLATAAR